MSDLQAIGASPWILPHPNLGPESLPTPEWSPSLGAWLTGSLVLAVLAGVALRMWRRSRTRAARQGPPAGSRGKPRLEDASDSDSARARLAALADAIREALATRFGDHWHAKTTEEIAADPSLEGILGAEAVEHLVALLQAADLAKFAGDRVPSEEFEAELQRAGPRSAAWLATLRPAPAAGARSTING